MQINIRNALAAIVSICNSHVICFIKKSHRDISRGLQREFAVLSI
jgi:hypothetical protein